MFTFENAGKKLKSTNYWDSEHAKKGALFFSINAGCIRMLIPDNMHHIISEIKTGKKIIISRGPWPDQNREDGFEILFDDYTEAPFTLHVGVEQWAMLPAKSNKWEFAAWTREGMVLEKRCYYRTVDHIPYGKPWGE
jgi:hypothetical protein